MSSPGRTRLSPRRWAAGFALAAALAGGAALPCHAVDWETDPQAAADPEYAAGKMAIEAKDWNAAIKSFSSAALRAPDNADIQKIISATPIAIPGISMPRSGTTSARSS